MFLRFNRLNLTAAELGDVGKSMLANQVHGL